MPNPTKLLHLPAGSLWLFQDADGALSVHRSVEADEVNFDKPLVRIPAAAAPALAFALLEDRLKGRSDAMRDLLRLLERHEIMQEAVVPDREAGISAERRA